MELRNCSVSNLSVFDDGRVAHGINMNIVIDDVTFNNVVMVSPQNHHKYTSRSPIY